MPTNINTLLSTKNNETLAKKLTLPEDFHKIFKVPHPTAVRVYSDESLDIEDPYLFVLPRLRGHLFRDNPELIQEYPDIITYYNVIAAKMDFPNDVYNKYQKMCDLYTIKYECNPSKSSIRNMVLVYKPYAEASAEELKIHVNSELDKLAVKLLCSLIFDVSFLGNGDYGVTLSIPTDLTTYMREDKPIDEDMYIETIISFNTMNLMFNKLIKIITYYVKEDELKDTIYKSELISRLKYYYGRESFAL